MTTSPQHEPLFPTLPVGLGAYTLTQLLGCHGVSDSYIARQCHVERHVVLEVLRPATEEGGGEGTELFLATARARGAANLPHVAAVLESATSPEGYTYICQSLPEGTPLSALAAEGKQLTPQQVCDLVSTAGSLYEAAAAAGVATAPLTADMVFLNREGAFHFLSPVQAGSPEENASCNQLRGLAEAILAVQPTNVPGQGRIATLLHWMSDGYEGEALDWPATANTAALIAEQLRPDTILHIHHPQRYDKGRAERADKRRRRQLRRNVLLFGAAAMFILAMGAAGALLAPDFVPPIPALRSGYVHLRTEDRELRVAEQPVSIAEYRRFLEVYAEMDAPRRGVLTQGIPPTECDPTPADWDAQLRTPEQQAPVTNVSYWQALMYARYRRGTLPAAAALVLAREQAGHPGVEEWTQEESPERPPYTKARIVLPAAAGASPIAENDPAVHHPQRGFRICR